MAVIKGIESKLRFVKSVSIATIFVSLVVSIGAFIYAYNVNVNANKNIYVLSNNIPIMAMKTDLESNRPVEYKSQINYFHSLFFNVTPDDKFIDNQIEKAMYLIDESGIQQYRNMKEKGFYTSILSSNSIVSLITDSIEVDVNNMTFIFYGQQVIDRKTSRVKRNLITSGGLLDIPRSENNAHGVLITDWKTIENKDVSFVEKNR